MNNKLAAFAIFIILIIGIVAVVSVQVTGHASKSTSTKPGTVYNWLSKTIGGSKKPAMLWGQQDLVYVCEERDLCIIHHNGLGQQVILTNPNPNNTKYITPQWSPDGNKIAFLEAVESGAGTRNLSIKVINKFGTVTTVQKIENKHPDIENFEGLEWTADSNHIITYHLNRVHSPGGGWMSGLMLKQYSLDGTFSVVRDARVDCTNEDYEEEDDSYFAIGDSVFFPIAMNTEDKILANAVVFSDPSDLSSEERNVDLLNATSNQVIYLNDRIRDADWYCNNEFFVFAEIEYTGPTGDPFYKLTEGRPDGSKRVVYSSWEDINEPTISMGAISHNSQPAMDTQVAFTRFVDDHNEIWLYDYFAPPSSPWFLTKGRMPDFKVTNWPCI